MAEPKDEEAVVANGFGPPEEKDPDAVPEDKSGDEAKISEKKKDVEQENKASEQEKEKENGVGTEMEEEMGKEEKESEEEKNKGENAAGTEIKEKENEETEDVKMAEAEDVKVEEKSFFKGVEEGVEGKKANEEDAVEEEEGGEGSDAEMKVDESEEVETPKEKRSRGRKPGVNVDKKEKKGSRTKEKESPRTPASSTIDRPVRERRTVERLVEVIEKGPNRGFLIDKGRGTPLKDIPNVAYKLARKKPADLKLLHQTLFGRRGKALNYRTHILQFSGFSWPENDEKQRAKVKEKLDKFVKDMLVDFCDLFDIPISKTGTKKEDLVVKLLDFMVAPHATTDVILAEKDQSKSRKRKRVARGSASKSSGGTSGKGSRKKQNKGEGPTSTKGRDTQEAEDEDEEDNESVSDEDKTLEHSDSEENEKESEEAEGDEEDDEDPKKGKQDKKKPPKQRSSAKKEKIKVEITPKKTPITAVKSSSKLLSSKHTVEETNDAGEKVFSRKKKNADVSKKNPSPKAEKEKSAGKRVATGKGKSEDTKPSGPSKDELRKRICEILKEVDFNTATFTDILKKLATHYKVDLTPRKSAIKLMIQEELTKLAEEAEENEENDDDEDAEKGDNSKASGKELEA